MVISIPAGLSANPAASWLIVLLLGIALVLPPDRLARSRLRALWPRLPQPKRSYVRHTGLIVGSAALTGWLLANIGGAISAALIARTLHWRWLRQRQADRAAQSAAELAEAVRRVADELRTGAHPATALAGIDGDGRLAQAVLAPAAAAAQLGEDVPSVLTRQADAHPEVAHALRYVAAAWDVAERHGVPLAELLGCVQAELRWRLRHAAAVRADLAGPRATANVLTALPALGVLFGQLVGADPVDVLRGGVGQVLLVVGAGLTATGAAWSERILSRAVLR